MFNQCLKILILVKIINYFCLQHNLKCNHSKILDLHNTNPNLRTFIDKLLLKKLTFFLLLFNIILGFAQSRNYSNEFLNIGVDAAALGQSNAVVARTGDVNSGYWNPAGLIELKDKQIALLHSNYFANIANYNYAAFAKPLDDKSAIAISIIRFAVDDILDTTQLIDNQGNINFDRISLFSAADWALTFSYARHASLLGGFNYGINAKVIRRIIGDFAASWGFGFDASVQFSLGNNWTFGANVRDITTSFNAWAFDDDRLADIQNAVEGQNQDIPEANEITIPRIQIGVAKSLQFNNDYTLEGELDLNIRFEQNNDIISSTIASINPAIGFEFGYVNLVFLRAGLGNFQNEIDISNNERLSFQPNFGVGFKYRGIYVDYAFTDIGDQSAALYSNVFSVKLDFSIFR